ncbi:MAG: hypothetical protein Kow00128_19850 [Deltaproteobacteria bacterium]
MRSRILLAVLIVSGIAVFPPSAHAVPSLQLDIGSGVYDWSTQTIVATSNPFTLYALLRETDKNPLSDTYYISAALMPKTVPPGADLGSFTFDGATVNVTEGMVYGVPPVEADGTAGKDPGDLPKHGIFKTYFSEFSFSFDQSKKAREYDTQDDPGGFQVASGDDPILYYMAFNVDVGSLAAGYQIHFDLYNEKVRCSGDYDISAKAPFSHDAESAPVPEPGTMILLGSGLIGIAIFGKRKIQA